MVSELIAASVLENPLIFQGSIRSIKNVLEFLGVLIALIVFDSVSGGGSSSISTWRPVVQLLGYESIASRFGNL